MKEETADLDTLRAVVGQALSGRGAHVKTKGALDELDWQLAGARPGDAPHSIFRLVNHIVYWQDFGLAWLAGAKPETPEHADDSWPGAETPEDESEWKKLVGRYEEGLDEFHKRVEGSDLFAGSHKKSTLEVLQMIASHNSYHIGQVAQLRRMLGSWPPPGGGETW